MRRRLRLLLQWLVLAAAATGIAAWRILAEEPPPPRESPRPTSLVEREEVRLVTLDLVIEEKKRGRAGGWHPASGVRKDQVRVLVGGRVVEIDLFEDLCGPSEKASPEGAPAVSAPAAPGGRPPTATLPQPMEDAGPDGREAGSAARRFVLYFDLEHLTHNGRAAAFASASGWAAREARPGDEVMIVTAGNGLRIARPLRPVADGFLEDLDRVSRGPGASDFWAAGEEQRIRESKRDPRLRMVYANMDYEKTRRSLENLRDVMVLFDGIPGVKSLLLFEETIRRVPGQEYLPRRQPSDVMIHLDRLIRSANERNVRFYPVHATGLAAPRTSAHEEIDNALTHLASETGGRTATRTNLLESGFALASEDMACSYRAAFRIRPRFSGRTRTITVHVTDGDRNFRVRHRRTLDDPTREQIQTDAIRRALLAPSSARGFPVSVTAVPLFHHGGGARVRIEAGVLLRDLLSLPDPDRAPGARKVRVEFGGEIVPVTPEAEAGGRGGDWADADPGRESKGFGRQVEMALPAPRPGHVLPDSVAEVEEFDVSPGTYRAVVVASDPTLGSVAAGTADFRVDTEMVRLGPIGLAGEEPRVIPIEPGASPGAAEDPAVGKEHRIAPAHPALPVRARVAASPDAVAGAPAYLFYGVCPDVSSPPPAPQTEEGRAAFVLEHLTRDLECGEPVALEPAPRLIPVEDPGDPCFLLLEPIPAIEGAASHCRYRVSMGGPGDAAESRSLEFTVTSASSPGP